jgi:hypothetical protein
MLLPSVLNDVSVDVWGVWLLVCFAPGRNCQIMDHRQVNRLKGRNLTGSLHYTGICAFDTLDKPWECANRPRGV